MISSKKQLRQDGFTIIELLIATTIFSVILLIMTFGILQISRTYYKGVGLARTQEVARTISDEVAQAIQFGGDSIVMGAAGDGSQGRCIGGREFSYLLYRQLVQPATVPNHARHAMVVRDNVACGATAQQLSNTNAAGRELVSPRMRLTAMSINRIGATDLYSVTVGVGYGDNSVFVDRNSDGQINATDAPIECRNNQGSQFCATSELNTVVQRRVN
jgi:prepilin-type N-terminal cleavage/methylation domain-containing protein